MELSRKMALSLALQISGASRVTTNSWDAVIGKQYQVQFTPELSASWGNLGPAVTATGLSLSATDNATGGMRIYRVLRVN